MKPKINDFGQEVYESQGKCPKCNSTDIKYGAIMPEDDGVFYPATCNVCETEFKEYYLLNFLETIVEVK